MAKRASAKHLILTHLIPPPGAAQQGLWKVPGGALTEANYRKAAQDGGFSGNTIVATDLDHRIFYWNASAERLYGWKAGEVFGQRLDQLELGFDPTRFATAGKRILTVGDSHTYGLYLERHQAYPAQLQQQWDAQPDAPLGYGPGRR